MTFAAPQVLRYASLERLFRDLSLTAEPIALVIDLSGVAFAYPGAMVPLAMLADRLRSSGTTVDLIPPADWYLAEFFQKAGWDAALLGTDSPPAPSFKGTFVPLVRFADHNELNRAVTSVLEVASRSAALPTGVLSAIEWSLNEVADNVLQHSGHPSIGWMQVVAEPKAHRMEFAVADGGRGILDSLREGFPTLRSDSEALMKAIEPGTTRDKMIGQGNGLSGTFRIAQAARGFLNVRSGAADLHLHDSGKLAVRMVPMIRGTFVSLTIPTTTEVDVATALWGHEPVSFLEGEHLNDEGVVFLVSRDAPGFGNRASGVEASNRLANLMTEFPRERVIIDFRGVDLISASFADELVAKLAARLGIASFMGRVELRNMTSLVSRTLNAVIAQRLSAPD